MASSVFFGSTKPYNPLHATFKSSDHISPRSASLRVRANHKEAEMKIRCRKPWRCYPEADAIREEAHAWLRNYISIPKLEAADIPLLTMSMVPRGNIQGMTNFVKHGVAIVAFDDMIDSASHESHSRNEIFDHVLAILDGKVSPLIIKELPLLHAFNDVCGDIRNHATPLQWKRYVKSIGIYLEGLAEQPQLKMLPHSSPPSLSTYIRIRRKVLGCPVIRSLMEIALGVHIEEWLYPEFQRLHYLVDDYISFTNDIVSIEDDDGVLWNRVLILKATTGCTMREAILLTCEEVESIEAEFDVLHKKLKASPLVRDQPLLLEYLDVLSSWFSAYIVFSGRSTRHTTRHVTINDGDSLTLKLKFSF